MKKIGKEILNKKIIFFFLSKWRAIIATSDYWRCFYAITWLSYQTTMAESLNPMTAFIIVQSLKKIKGLHDEVVVRFYQQHNAFRPHGEAVQKCKISANFALLEFFWWHVLTNVSYIQYSDEKSYLEEAQCIHHKLLIKKSTGV